MGSTRFSGLWEGSGLITPSGREMDQELSMQRPWPEAISLDAKEPLAGDGQL